ncbi:MAG: hypothetical protein JWR75_144 [Devosia sp.]|nr:hypothetical protein [Devosia sp.]
MIRTFRHKGLKHFVERDDPKKLPPDMIERLRELLTALDDALGAEEMNLPSYRLHALKGDLSGHFAVTVRANWRLVFRFEGGDVWDLDFIDYH